MTDGLIEGLPAEFAFNVRCSECGVSADCSVPQIIDLEREPAWRPVLVQGAAHDFDCEHCGHLMRIEPPGFIVWEPVARRVLAISASSPPSAADLMRIESLRAGLQRDRPDVDLPSVEICGSYGALVDAVVAGAWLTPGIAALPMSTALRDLFRYLDPHVRVRLLDLLMAGGQQSMVAAANRDVELSAAMLVADPYDAKAFPPKLLAALQAVGRVSIEAPAKVIDAIVWGLAECTLDPDRWKSHRNLLHGAVASAAGRLDAPVVRAGHLSAQGMQQGWPASLASDDRAIVLYNIGAALLSGFELDEVIPGDTAATLAAMFDAAAAEQVPEGLKTMLLEQRGRARLDSIPPDLRGSLDLSEAASRRTAAGQPGEALKDWLRVMRWHTRQAVAEGLPADRVDDHSVAAAGAAGAIAQLVHAFEPSPVILDTMADLVNVMKGLPGNGRSERLGAAANFCRAWALLAKSIGDRSSMARAQIQLGNVLLDDTSRDDVVAVQETIDVLGEPEPGETVRTRIDRLATLAIAYKRRTIGSAAENLETAVGLYRSALESAEGIAGVDIDSIRYNLANVLMRRRLGVKKRDLAEALKLHRQVADSRVKANAAVQLQARSEVAIGNVLYERARLDTPPDPTSLDAAIEAYTKACALLELAGLPDDAAVARQMLALVHSSLARGDLRREEAVHDYEAAARLAVASGNRVLEEDIVSRLSGFVFNDRRLDAAVETYRRSLQLRKSLLADAVSGLTHGQRLATIAPVGMRLTFALIGIGQFDEAVDTLASVRALDLASALPEQQDTRSEPVAAYRSARARVLALDSEEVSLDARGADDGEAAERLPALHAELANARAEQSAAAARLAPPSGETGGIAAIALQCKPHELLAIPVVTDIGTALVCVTRTTRASPQAIRLLPDLRLNHVRAWLAARRSRTSALSGWISLIETIRSITTLASRKKAMRLLDDWLDALGRTELLVALRERLSKSGATRLRWVGGGGLQSLPIHLAFDPADGQPLLKTTGFVTQLGPFRSSSLNPSPPKRWLVFADPNDDLPFARWEAALIAEAMQTREDIQVRVFSGVEATRATMMEHLQWADALHFAGHAAHDPEQAGLSHLECADGALSVDALRQSTLHAPLKVVVLSACESGIVDAIRMPDEFIGLPAAFFGLGAHSVVSSMWAVPDEATAVLMADFHRRMLDGDEVEVALVEAQRHVACSTTAQLDIAARLARVNQACAAPDAVLTRRMAFHSKRPHERPFAHPLYWGAHVCQTR
ncbi:hypothetical protein BH10PSE17_BH10PSE17_03510 [soil metagenome]